MKTINRMLLMLLASVMILGTAATALAQEDPVAEAKQGIIGIFVGLEDKKKNFHIMYRAAGVVIASDNDQAYVLTSYRRLNPSAKKKKEYIEKNKLKMADPDKPEVVVKAVVQGDVTVNVELITDSTEKNFSVLRIDNGMCEKTPVPLGNCADLVTGDTIYTMGFELPEEDQKNIQYTAQDVSVRSGTIVNTCATKEERNFLQHTAYIDGGNYGGPLLDGEGYVVGLNDGWASDIDAGKFMSVPIDDIRVILDSFNIEYRSKEQASAEGEFDQALKRAAELQTRTIYDDDSMSILNAAVEEANELSRRKESGEEVSEEEYMEVIRSLSEAEEALVEKRPMSRTAVYVLGGVDLLLLAWLVKVLWKRRKLKKRVKEMGGIGEIPFGREVKPPVKGGSGGYPPVRGNTGTPPAGGGRDRQPGNPPSWGQDNHTMVILAHDIPGGTRQIQAVLIRCATNEEIWIEGSCFEIGADSKMDYVVRNNPAVSRCHAEIQWTGEGYVLIDKHSTNGTRINGAPLKVDTKYPLQNGDSVTLADERFVFRIKTDRR